MGTSITIDHQIKIDLNEKNGSIYFNLGNEPYKTSTEVEMKRLVTNYILRRDFLSATVEISGNRHEYIHIANGVVSPVFEKMKDVRKVLAQESGGAWVEELEGKHRFYVSESSRLKQFSIKEDELAFFQRTGLTLEDFPETFYLEGQAPTCESDGEGDSLSRPAQSGGNYMGMIPAPPSDDEEEEKSKEEMRRSPSLFETETHFSEMTFDSSSAEPQPESVRVGGSTGQLGKTNYVRLPVTTIPKAVGNGDSADKQTNTEDSHYVGVPPKHVVGSHYVKRLPEELQIPTDSSSPTKSHYVGITTSQPKGSQRKFLMPTFLKPENFQALSEKGLTPVFLQKGDLALMAEGDTVALKISNLYRELDDPILLEHAEILKKVPKPVVNTSTNPTAETSHAKKTPQYYNQKEGHYMVLEGETPLLPKSKDSTGKMSELQNPQPTKQEVSSQGNYVTDMMKRQAKGVQQAQQAPKSIYVSLKTGQPDDPHALLKAAAPPQEELVPKSTYFKGLAKLQAKGEQNPNSLTIGERPAKEAPTGTYIKNMHELQAQGIKQAPVGTYVAPAKLSIQVAQQPKEVQKIVPNPKGLKVATGNYIGSFPKRPENS